MNKDILEIILALTGGGAIGFLLRVVSNKAKQEKVIEQHDKDIECLKTNQVMLKDDLKKVEGGTNVRLTRIETQVTAIQTQQTEISKDVKLILKKNVYGGE